MVCDITNFFFFVMGQDVLCNIVKVGSSKIHRIGDKHRQALLSICGIIG